jgi:hypothetical protein
MVPSPRPSVAFVTTLDAAVLHDDFDLAFHAAAFAAANIDLVHVPWEAPDTDWDSFDLVVVRSPWNYVDRIEDFRRWLTARRSLVSMHNSATIIGWNLDKRYLAELGERGVPVVPTTFASTGAELADAVRSVDAAQVVVKPTISAGSRLTGRFVTGSPGAVTLGERILAAGFTVMAQPFISSVEAVGEIGTVLIDGEISHSFRKGPLLADEGALKGGEYREEITAAALTAVERDLVVAANEAVEVISRAHHRLGPDEHLLYARYDLVTLDDGSPLLLEAELFEPSLFLMVDPSSPQRFVEAVRARL